MFPQEKTPEVDQSPEAQERRAELRAKAARDLVPWIVAEGWEKFLGNDLEVS